MSKITILLILLYNKIVTVLYNIKSNSNNYQTDSSIIITKPILTGNEVVIRFGGYWPTMIS